MANSPDSVQDSAAGKAKCFGLRFTALREIDRQ